MDTPADVLRRAADRVQFQGWTQGTAVRYMPPGPVPWYRRLLRGAVSRIQGEPVAWCAYGAIGAEAAEMYPMWATLHRAAKAFGAFLGQPVSVWNDAPGRTADEVADAMRRCAKALENGEL
jgi:hypothetical protein